MEDTSPGSCSSSIYTTNEQSWIYFRFAFEEYIVLRISLYPRSQQAVQVMDAGDIIIHHLGYDPCEEQSYIPGIIVNFGHEM
jgi:hypothetical protein